MIKKAFALLDLVISLFIISCLTIFSLNSYKTVNNKHYEFINKYLDTKLYSYINKERRDIDEYNIHFNERGNINIGKTINIDNHNIILHLGNGYLTYE